MWFQQVKQPFVTSGNRAAAVMAGFNIVIFSTIALLARNEKLAKKRDGAGVEGLVGRDPHGDREKEGVEVDVRTL